MMEIDRLVHANDCQRFLEHQHHLKDNPGLWSWQEHGLQLKKKDRREEYEEAVPSTSSAMTPALLSPWLHLTKDDDARPGVRVSAAELGSGVDSEPPRATPGEVASRNDFSLSTVEVEFLGLRDRAQVAPAAQPTSSTSLLEQPLARATPRDPPVASRHGTIHNSPSSRPNLSATTSSVHPDPWTSSCSPAQTLRSEGVATPTKPNGSAHAYVQQTTMTASPKESVSASDCTESVSTAPRLCPTPPSQRSQMLSPSTMKEQIAGCLPQKQISRQRHVVSARAPTTQLIAVPPRATSARAPTGQAKGEPRRSVPGCNARPKRSPSTTPGFAPLLHTKSSVVAAAAAPSPRFVITGGEAATVVRPSASGKKKEDGASQQGAEEQSCAARQRPLSEADWQRPSQRPNTARSGRPQSTRANLQRSLSLQRGSPRVWRTLHTPQAGHCAPGCPVSFISPCQAERAAGTLWTPALGGGVQWKTDMSRISLDFADSQAPSTRTPVAVYRTAADDGAEKAKQESQPQHRSYTWNSDIFRNIDGFDHASTQLLRPELQ